MTAGTSLVWTSSATHDERGVIKMDLRCVRNSPCPERTGLRQCNLSCSSSSLPGFDKLEEELRTFEGLVKTYHAIFGDAISDSITQAVIKSQMLAEIRTHPELQTFARTTDLVNLMSSLSKIRTAATSSSSTGHGPTPMEIGYVKGKGQGKSKNKEKGKGKRQEQRKGKRKTLEREVRGVV